MYLHEFEKVTYFKISYNGKDICASVLEFTYAIEEWFVPTINSMYTIPPTTLKVMEKDLDKWGVWFRVKVTDMYGVNYIDFGINKENKLRSIIL